MKIDCSTYLMTLNKFKHIIEDAEDIPRAASKMSSITYVPLIACIIYAIGLRGETEGLRKQFKSIVDFYGYSEIIDTEGNLYKGRK